MYPPAISAVKVGETVGLRKARPCWGACGQCQAVCQRVAVGVAAAAAIEADKNTHRHGLRGSGVGDRGLIHRRRQARGQAAIGDALVAQGQRAARVDVTQVVRRCHELRELGVDQSHIGQGDHAVLVHVARQQSDAHGATAPCSAVRGDDAAHIHRDVLCVGRTGQRNAHFGTGKGGRSHHRHAFGDRCGAGGHRLVECEYNRVHRAGARLRVAAMSAEATPRTAIRLTASASGTRVRLSARPLRVRKMCTLRLLPAS